MTELIRKFCHLGIWLGAFLALYLVYLGMPKVAEGCVIASLFFYMSACVLHKERDATSLAMGFYAVALDISIAIAIL